MSNSTSSLELSEIDTITITDLLTGSYSRDELLSYYSVDKIDRINSLIKHLEYESEILNLMVLKTNEDTILTIIDPITTQLNKVRDLILQVKLLLNVLKIIYTEEKYTAQFDEINNVLENITDNYSEISTYVEYEENKKSGKSLNLLAIVSAICLPLGIITGYFGMNFDGMTNGIFKIKYPQLFILGLVILLCTAMVLIYIYSS